MTRRGRIVYTDEEMAWLEDNFRLVLGDYHRGFVEAFGRDDVTMDNLKQLRTRKGWKVGRDGGRYKGRNRKYAAEELAWLEANCALPLDAYVVGFCERFGRADVTPAKLLSLRKRRGWKTGRTGRFEKGNVSHNKGKTCPPGTGGRHPNAQRTQFRKGNVPHTFKGGGHEWIDGKDGYVVLIVNEPNPWTGAKTRPVHKHRWLWEQNNGPVPDGFVLKCLDGDKTNCDASNWELIPRGVLPHLSARFGMGFDHAAPETKPVIMTLARLKHAVKEARRRKRDQSAPAEDGRA